MKRHHFTAAAALLTALGAMSFAHAADLNACATCHGNITESHAGAAHKSVPCTTCTPVLTNI